MSRIDASGAMERERLCEGTDFCVAFRRASRAITHLYDLVLAPTGLKATQFIILQAIREHAPIAQCRLASCQGISIDSLSRRLSALRKAGLVTVRVETRGRRRHYYWLTEEGIQKLKAAEPYWFRAQQRLYTSFNGEDWARLLAGAAQVSQAATRAELAKQNNLDSRLRPAVPASTHVLP